MLSVQVAQKCFEEHSADFQLMMRPIEHLWDKCRGLFACKILQLQISRSYEHLWEGIVQHFSRGLPAVYEIDIDSIHQTKNFGMAVYASQSLRQSKVNS